MTFLDHPFRLPVYSLLLEPHRCKQTETGFFFSNAKPFLGYLGRMIDIFYIKLYVTPFSFEVFRYHNNKRSDECKSLHEE